MARPLEAGARVAIGEWTELPDWTREQVRGTVIKPIGGERYIVRLDDGITLWFYRSAIEESGGP